MTRFESPRYPGLVLAGLNTHFRDGVLDTDDEAVIERLSAPDVALMGVVRVDPERATPKTTTRKRSPRKRAAKKD